MTDPASLDLTDDWKCRWDRRRELKVRALSNRLYQLERQLIMEWREGSVKVASLAASSVAVANVSNQSIIRYAAAVIFIGTCCSLVFGWGNKARDAAKRAADCVALAADIEMSGEREFTEDQLNAWAARSHVLEAGEPAQHAALFERCYRRACADLGVTPAGATAKPRWRPTLFIP